MKQPYIRVVGLEQDRETNSSGPSTFTMDEVYLYIYFLIFIKIEIWLLPKCTTAAHMFVSVLFFLVI